MYRLDGNWESYCNFNCFNFRGPIQIQLCRRSLLPLYLGKAISEIKNWFNGRRRRVRILALNKFRSESLVHNSGIQKHRESCLPLLLLLPIDSGPSQDALLWFLIKSASSKNSKKVVSTFLLLHMIMGSQNHSFMTGKAKKPAIAAIWEVVCCLPHFWRRLSLQNSCQCQRKTCVFCGNEKGWLSPRDTPDGWDWMEAYWSRKCQLRRHQLHWYPIW